MKKILGLLVIFTIVVGLVSAQGITVSASTKTSSDTAVRDAAPDAPIVFKNLKQGVSASVEAGKWGADAGYNIELVANDKHWADFYSTGTGDWSCDLALTAAMDSVKVWYAPTSALKLTVGSNPGSAVSPSKVFSYAYGNHMGAFADPRGADWQSWNAEVFNKGISSNTNITGGGSVAKYGVEGINLDFTGVPNLKLALAVGAQTIASGHHDSTSTTTTVTGYNYGAANYPLAALYGTIHNGWVETETTTTTIVDYDHDRRFGLKFNVAAEYKIANAFDVAAVYKGGFGGLGLNEVFADKAQFGLYGGFNAQNFNVALGWSGTLHQYNDYGIGMAGELARDVDMDHSNDTRLLWGGAVQSFVNLAGKIGLNNGMTLGLGAEVGLNTVGALPIAIGFNYEYPNIVDSLSFNVRTTWEHVAYIAGNSVTDTDGTSTDTGKNLDRAYGKIAVTPNFTYSAGKHGFEVGAKVWCDYYSLSKDIYPALDKDDADYLMSYLGFSVPVSYTYEF